MDDTLIPSDMKIEVLFRYAIAIWSICAIIIAITLMPVFMLLNACRWLILRK